METKLRTLLGKLPLIRVTIPRPSDNRGVALAGLDALGSRAKNAVPALEGLLHETPPDHRALIVLAGIGPEALPALNRALTNEEKVIRQGARVCLNMQQTHPPKTVEDAEFMRKTCEFNAGVLRAALMDYRAHHPEQFFADGVPRPTLPPDFVPPELPETNGAAVHLPNARPSNE